MRRNRSSLWSDVAFLAFLVLCYVTILYLAGDPDRYLQNLFLLNIVFLLAIITYFTTVTAGLVLNVAFIFAYGAFILYRTVTGGEAIQTSAYFWIVLAPLLTLAVWVFTWSSRQLQTENDQLKQQKERLATLDESTDLKTSLAFQKDLSVFAGISERYDIPLTLVVIKVKFWNEMRRFIRAEELADAVLDITKISQASIRTNDTLYLLDKENVTWGLLLFTDREGSKVVMDRIRSGLSQFNTQDFADKYKVQLNLKIGAVEYHKDSVESALDFVSQAQRQLEYDV
ncbi:diguanylate cyclase domain-containing protein [Gorillibacterium timonense]|uniref:diguanylate cyclase domain-containing protein n=1 Tax=Gorillibacterium timonense TaxID=1689269 RepID=UPI00071DB63F|nr:diguanylate cyclase [Gorillibacterium timonense]